MTIFGAGFETTLNSLNWVLYYLAKYPDIQDRIRKEVQCVGELDGKDFNLQRLPWVYAVHAEVLRIRNPLAVHLRKCVDNITVSGIKG